MPDVFYIGVFIFIVRHSNSLLIQIRKAALVGIQINFVCNKHMRKIAAYFIVYQIKFPMFWDIWMQHISFSPSHSSKKNRTYGNYSSFPYIRCYLFN